MKKILIVNTQSINHNNATGITLRSIFEHVSLENCYELYMQPCVRAKDALELRSQRLPAVVCLMRTLANRFLRGKDTPAANSAGTVEKKRNIGWRTRLIAALDYEPIVLTPGLLKKIQEFSPDCIYTLGNAIDVMKLCVKLSKRLHIPIVPHFMDNWQASHRYGPEVLPYHKKRTQAWLKKLYARTEKALTISHKMADAYEARWGKPHYALMNSVNVKYYREGCQEKRIDDGAFVLTYAGGLHLNRYKSVLELGHVIDAHNQAAVRPIRFMIYTDDKSLANYADQLKTVHSIEVHSYVPHDRILEVYKDCDALVHIESFDAAYREFILYSMSTKISEFLSTGKPILLYAPADIFACEYLKENGAGVVVSDAKEIPAALDALTNEANAEVLGAKAYALAVNNHDIVHLRRTLEDIF